MPEYIEREALIKNINETVVFTVRKGVSLPTSEMRGANKVIDQIKSAPTADVVEVRHGEWIYKPSSEQLGGTDATYDYECSVCNQLALEESDYCPNCGAKMDGFR